MAPVLIVVGGTTTESRSSMTSARTWLGDGVVASQVTRYRAPAGMIVATLMPSAPSITLRDGPAPVPGGETRMAIPSLLLFPPMNTRAPSELPAIALSSVYHEV